MLTTLAVQNESPAGPIMNINVSTQRLSNYELLRPNISLHGGITTETLNFFLQRLQDVRDADEHMVAAQTSPGRSQWKSDC